jgi:hypothetical protein
MSAIRIRSLYVTLLLILLTAGFTQPLAISGERSTDSKNGDVIRFQPVKDCGMLAFSPDGNHLAFALSGSLVIREIPSADIVANSPWPESSNGACRDIMFSENGTRIITIHQTQNRIDSESLDVWSFSHRRELELVTTLRIDNRSDSSSRIFGPLIVGTRDNAPNATTRNRSIHSDRFTVSVESAQNSYEHFEIACPHGVQSACISPDDQLLVIAEKRGVLLVNANNGATVGWWSATGPIAFSSDNKRVAWRESDSIVVRNLADVIAQAKTPPGQFDSEPPNAPLRIELVSKLAEYKLAQATRERGNGGPVKVDMELAVRNVSDSPLSLSRSNTISVFVLGRGAINDRWEVCVGEPQDAAVPASEDEMRQGSSGASASANERKPPKEDPEIKLAPGQVYRIPVHTMDDRGSNSRWTMPGEHRVYASYYASFRRLTKDGKSAVEESAKLFAEPAKVTVTDR